VMTDVWVECKELQVLPCAVCATHVTGSSSCAPVTACERHRPLQLDVSLVISRVAIWPYARANKSNLAFFDRS